MQARLLQGCGQSRVICLSPSRASVRLGRMEGRVHVGCGWNNSSALRLLACDFCCLAAACWLTCLWAFGYPCADPFPWPCTGRSLDASHGPALSPWNCSCPCLCTQHGGMRSRNRAARASFSCHCAQPVNFFLAPSAPVPADCTCRSLACVRRWRWWRVSFLRGNGCCVGIVAVCCVWGCRGRRLRQLRMRARICSLAAAGTLGSCCGHVLSGRGRTLEVPAGYGPRWPTPVTARLGAK